MSAGGPFKPRLGTHCVGRRKEEKLAANFYQIIMQQVAPGSCATLYILQLEMDLRKVKNLIIKERALVESATNAYALTLRHYAKWSLTHGKKT